MKPSLRTCNYCGSYDHTTDYCGRTWGGQSNRAHLRCAYCGSRQHNRDACPKAWPGPNPVIVHDWNGGERNP